jgi:hypothetical protein
LVGEKGRKLGGEEMRAKLGHCGNYTANSGGFDGVIEAWVVKLCSFHLTAEWVNINSNKFAFY